MLNQPLIQDLLKRLHTEGIEVTDLSIYRFAHGRRKSCGLRFSNFIWANFFALSHARVLSVRFMSLFLARSGGVKPGGRALTVIAAAVLCLVVAPSAAAASLLKGGDGERWTLSRLIEEAVATHPSVRASKDAMEGGRARVRSARWGYFPSPSVGVETQTLDGNPVLTAGVTQPLWTGGKLRADLNLARAQLDASKWGIAEAQNNLALQVVDQHQQFSSAMMVLSAYDQYIVGLSEFSAMMRRRVAQGYSADVDAKLVLARLNEARNVRTNLLLTQRTTVEALSFLTGQELAARDIVLSDDGAEVYALTISDAEFLRRSRRVNPTLNRLSEEIEAAQAGVAQARSALSPVIALRAQHRELSFSPVTENRVFLTLDFSLGGGLSSLENIRSARMAKNEARHSRDAFQIDLSTAIINDLETLKATKRLIDVLSVNRVTQQEIYQSYLRMFLVGQRTWLDVLNVMREAVEAERNLAEARARYEATLFRLRINVGDVTWAR